MRIEALTIVRNMAYVEALAGRMINSTSNDAELIVGDPNESELAQIVAVAALTTAHSALRATGLDRNAARAVIDEILPLIGE